MLRQPLWVRGVSTVALAGLAGVLVVGGIDEGGWLLVLCLAGASAVVAVTVRNWLLRIEAGKGVTVVNWFATLHVPWAEVERFGYDVGDGLWVRPRSGRQHSIAAFAAVTGALAGAERRGRAAAAELEAIRKKRRRW